MEGSHGSLKYVLAIKKMKIWYYIQNMWIKKISNISNAYLIKRIKLLKPNIFNMTKRVWALGNIKPTKDYIYQDQIFLIFILSNYWQERKEETTYWKVLPKSHCQTSVKALQSPGWCGSVDWLLACEPKSHQFGSQSGPMPGLQARSSLGAVWETTKHSTLTHQCFSSFLSPFLPLSLKINK